MEGEIYFSLPVRIDILQDDKDYPFTQNAAVYMGTHLVDYLDKWVDVEVAAMQLINKKLFHIFIS